MPTLQKTQNKEKKPASPRFEIRDVWSYNLLPEISNIGGLLKDYPVVSFDTEFPGFLATRKNSPHLDAYSLIKANVDSLHLIQLGITLSDEEGNLPSPVCSWQFNLSFDLEYLYLDGNTFSGELPTTISQLTNLSE